MTSFTGFKLYLTAGASAALDYATTASYVLTVTCFDAYGSTSEDLTVNVSPNASPTISNLPATVAVSESSSGGNSIITVTVSDTESDPFSCGIQSVTPSVAAFQISQNGASKNFGTCLHICCIFLWLYNFVFKYLHVCLSKLLTEYFMYMYIMELRFFNFRPS